MFHDSEQLSFNHGLVLFFFAMKFSFDDLLHGVRLVIFVDEKNVAVGAFAYDALDLEVLEGDFFLEERSRVLHLFYSFVINEKE